MLEEEQNTHEYEVVFHIITTRSIVFKIMFILIRKKVFFFYVSRPQDANELRF